VILATLVLANLSEEMTDKLSINHDKQVAMQRSEERVFKEQEASTVKAMR
jgi:hypothetical protein